MTYKEMAKLISYKLKKDIGAIIDDDDLLELCSLIVALTVKETFKMLDMEVDE